MFYSHEILTSRQHGVATVWLIQHGSLNCTATDFSTRLVATLGSKSALKKVTRKAILDVNVPKACKTIQDPSAPMALRLQGNLLYGVSQVYSQQCAYVLGDTQNFRDKMKGAVVTLKELEIDPEAGKARPDQLNLPDDPAFLPDFDMNLDLSMFDISGDVSGYSGSMSPLSLLSSCSSAAREAVLEPVLVLTSTDTAPDNGFGGFRSGDTISALRTASHADRVSVFEDTGMIEDPGFEYDFDAEGNLVEHPTVGERERAALSAPGLARRLGSELATSAQVHQSHEAAVGVAQVARDNALDDAPALVFEDEDDHLRLPEAPRFSPTPRLSTTPAQQAPHSSSVPPEEEGSSSIGAPQRQGRASRVLQPDHRPELANTDLAQWNNNYLANMAEATRIKQQNRASSLAKKNAAFWVLGQGIAGVGIGSRDGRVPNPLEVFIGQALLAALTPRDGSSAGTKRTRSVSNELNGGREARRVRGRGEKERQVGRAEAGGGDAEGPLLGDDGMMFPGEEMDIEIGRHAQESLHGDRSSQMPWNLSGSRHGSARPFRGVLLGAIGSSVGGPGAGIDVGGPRAFVGRHGSRFTSASPLLRIRGTLPRYSSLELPEQPKLTTDEACREIFDDAKLQPGGNDLEDDLEFQLYGPAATVDTQTAAQSQWVTAALDTESQNFLAFLRAEIDAKISAAEPVAGRLEDENVNTVTFEGLLPPEQHSQVVAAQGLLHVLSLATKGLVEVSQEDAFGTIQISIVAAEEGNEDGGQNVEA